LPITLRPWSQNGLKLTALSPPCSALETSGYTSANNILANQTFRFYNSCICSMAYTGDTLPIRCDSRGQDHPLVFKLSSTHDRVGPISTLTVAADKFEVLVEWVESFM